MTNERTAHLWFAGIEPRALSLIAPINTDTARGMGGYGEFVLEHRPDSESLIIFLTVENDSNTPVPVKVSVEFPAALVRDLIDRVIEQAAEGSTGAQA